jgi:hypothetical protein
VIVGPVVAGPLAPAARRSAVLRGVVGAVATLVAVVLPLLLVGGWRDGAELGWWALVVALVTPVLLAVATVRCFVIARRRAASTARTFDRVFAGAAVLIALWGGFTIVLALGASGIASVVLLVLLAVIAVWNFRAGIGTASA